MKASTSFVAGLATATLAFSLISGAGAATRTEMIKAEFANIKIVMDGAPITPKDANGNTVEPFIYNGTTYLPVRAVGSAIGKKVEWDANSKTVYLGETAGTTQADKFTQFKSALTTAGYKFEEVSMAASLVGATKGIKYQLAADSAVELYQFDMASDAYKKAVAENKLVLEGFGTMDVTVKDGFAIYLGNTPDAAKLREIFNSLK